MKWATRDTPLHRAVQNNDLDRVKLLLNNGADPCAINVEGETSLYLAADHGYPDIVMALLNSDASNASVSISTSEKKLTVLHRCLLGGDIKMTECVKELVRRGADVGIRNIYHQSPIDVALEYKWSKDMIELLILQGRGMDFDREHPASFCGTLHHGVFRLLPDPWHTRCNPLEHDKFDLALLFLQMGASRLRLKSLLWYELNREEPRSLLLDTLMDSFAYLPSLSQLKHSGSTCSRIHIIKLLDMINQTARPQSRQNEAPASHVTQKKEDYCRRRREIPTLAHLCRSTIRHTLKADVRRVISLPIPTAVKEYILLGYQIKSQGQKDGEKKVSHPTAVQKEGSQNCPHPRDGRCGFGEERGENVQVETGGGIQQSM